jgi:hypothetical protein
MKKKAAMEMSVGTIVTIVLLMAILVLGLVLIRTIFKGSVENIDGIDTAIKSEIDKLFAENADKKIVIFPPTREVVIKKGEDTRGFGISIRNIDEEAKFSYDITAQEASCDLRLSEAEDFISLNQKRNNIQIGGGTIMDDPIFVKFKIPESAPPCQVTYTLVMERDGQLYGSATDIYLTIKSK